MVRGSGRVGYFHRFQLASMEELKRQTLPVLRQAWMNRPVVGSDAQAAEPKDDRLPGTAGRGGMDAIPGVPTHIPQVRTDGPDEMFIGIVRFADVTGHNGHNGWTERGAIAVIGARIVVLIIHADRLIRVVISQNVLH